MTANSEIAHGLRFDRLRAVRAVSSLPDVPVTASVGERVLFLGEGNAETYDSWSGVSRSVVLHLRAEGHRVDVGDADLYGAARALVALRTFALPRRRWWVRYHLHEAAFRARSAACARLVRSCPEVDVLYQIGATFEPPASRAPLVLYCDSNIEMSRLGSASGQSEAAMLTAREVEGVREREGRVYRRAERIFTMSERLRRSFIEDFGIAPQRLITVHCGPNIELPPVRTEGGSGGPPTILFVGRDFERKGGPLLLEAFARVRRALPGARLRIIGGRPSEARDEPGVEYLGFLSRDVESSRLAMDAVYRSATVFCIPTRFEPFGTSFVEAMMYGLPCVGPSVWAVPEIIVPGETGWLVPPDDAPALAEALQRLLVDPALAARMGAAGRERALRHFSWPSAARKMSAAFAEVLGRAGSATGVA